MTYSVAPVDPFELAARLGVDITITDGWRGASSSSESSSQDSEPVDLDAHPRVREELSVVTDPPDRSVDTFRIVAACIDDGLTLAQARWVVGQRSDLAGRLDERNDDDVLRSWQRAQAERERLVQELKETAGLAEWPGHSGQLGMAYRLAKSYPDRLLYASGMGWLYWDDTRFARDDIGKTKQAVYAMFKALWPHAYGGDDESVKLKNTIIRCESSAGVEGILKLAQALPRFAATVDSLDSNPYALNTPDGIIDLRTGECGPHDSRARHTKMTGAGCDPDADCPRWKTFLDTTFGGDQEIIEYTQRLLGYTAIGEVSRHILPFCHGGGDNGKTVLLEVCMAVLGSYAITAPANFLLAGRDKHETEIARLCGARLVVASEINQDSKFDESKVKWLTGGDRLTGRFLYGNFFDFDPSHTLVLIGNHQPEVSAGGKSFWRRLRLIPFLHEVPAELRNENLARELVEEEGPGILAWIVAGAQAFIGKGLDDPPGVMTATKDYAESEDHVQQFIEECCTHVSDTHRVPYGEVYQRYASWCKENGITPKPAQIFGRDLVSHGFRPGKSDGKRYVYAIMLDTIHDDPRNPQ